MTLVNIIILCKVVDNYGDIGVAYRLCRTLRALAPAAQITIVVDGILSFHAICPEVNAASSVQTISSGNAAGVTVLDWNSTSACKHCVNIWQSGTVILQCFQCGYPAWLEDILFGASSNCGNDARRDTLSAADVYVIDIDYLTAEAWADDYHLMASLTRSSRVHKTLFMPGFSSATGGLLMNGRIDNITNRLHHSTSHIYTVLVFGYERDYTPLVEAFARFNQDINLCVYAARGAGLASVLTAWQKNGKPFTLEVLDYLRQEEWDKMLQSVDLSFVRGEDSLAGAALSGVPYVWEAYRQEGGAHIKKVEALLRRMKCYFNAPQYDALYALWMAWNNGTYTAEALYTFMLHADDLRTSFKAFAASLVPHKDMAANLLEYITAL